MQAPCLISGHFEVWAAARRASPYLSVLVAAACLMAAGCEQSEESDAPTPGANHVLVLGGDSALDMIWIPAGEFVMGSPGNEASRKDDEVQHVVRISKGFWMSKTEVKQLDYQQLTAVNVSMFPGALNPVERVSWDQAKEFCRRIEARLGRGHFRLPTEAEWEYACRAGTTTPYYTGNADTLGTAAWYGANSGGATHPVNEKAANAFGLADMHGNVWEWCEDWYGDYPAGPVTDPTGPASGSAKVVRGGSWSRVDTSCRSASRESHGTGNMADYLGFRIVRTID